MKDSALIKILGTYTPEEIKDFDEFVRSMYFNKNKNVAKLYGYLKNQYPEFNEKKILKENVYKKIYPGRKYSDNFIRQIIHLLQKLGQEYLIYSRLSRNEIDKKTILLSELNDRKLDMLFNKEHLLLKQLQAGEKERDENYYLRDFNIEKEASEFKSHRFVLHYNETEEQYLAESKSLAIYYFVNVIRKYIYLISEAKIIKIDYSASFLDDIKELIKKYKYDEIPLVSLYLNLLEMSRNEDDEKYFYSVKKLLKENLGLFNRNTAYEVYMALQNHCSLKTYKGDIKFYDELFDIYNEMLSNKVIFSSKTGHISLVNFKNFAIVGVNLKNYQWVESFINSNRKKLAPAERENGYNYCMGILSFEKGDFNKALEYAGKTKYEDIFYKMEIRVLTIKIYYELALFDELSYVTDGFRHFLAGNKPIPAYLKEANRNFIRMIEQLKKVKLKNDLQAAEELRKKISDAQFIMSRIWLLKKLDEVK